MDSRELIRPRLHGSRFSEHVGTLDPLDVPARLDELRNLKDGWADGMQYAGDWGNGYGKAPSHTGLNWLSDSFERHYPEDVPLPHTYPTPEGGVQMEWSLGSREVSVEVDLSTHRAEWRWLDISTHEEDERILNLDDARAWKMIASEVRRMAGCAR